MSGIQNFGLFLQTAAIEYGRYREVREQGEEDAKRRMYALEKRHKAGDKLHPTELCFLLNMQDKYGRSPAVSDRPVVVRSLQERISEALKNEKPLPPPEVPIWEQSFLSRIGATVVAGFSVGLMTMLLMYAVDYPLGLTGKVIAGGIWAALLALIMASSPKEERGEA